MSHDKIPITSEKTYTFSGIIDIKYTYNFLKDFLENSKHYAVSEKEFEEANNPGSKKIVANWQAEQEYNDYYKVILKMKLELGGKDIEVELNGHQKVLSQGKAVLTLNSYIEPDFQGKYPKGQLAIFLEKIHNKFFGGEDELKTCIGSSAKDVSEIFARFKLALNSYMK